MGGATAIRYKSKGKPRADPVFGSGEGGETDAATLARYAGLSVACLMAATMLA
jgi:hypothetical protein